MDNRLKTRDLEEQKLLKTLLYLHAYHAFAEHEGEERDIWPERLNLYHVISSIPPRKLVWFEGINHTIGKFDNRINSPIATGSALIITEKDEHCIVQYWEHIIALENGEAHQQYWQQRNEVSYDKNSYSQVCNMLETTPLMAEEKADSRQQIVSIIREKHLRHQAGQQGTTKVVKT